MELTQKMNRAPSRAAYVVATAAALGLGLVGGWALHPSAVVAQPAAVAVPSATSPESPRVGGPGGQVGDVDQAPRLGGPGGQVGDAP
jgi:hypothetical protein